MRRIEVALLITLGLVLAGTKAQAQLFQAQPAEWRTDNIRVSGFDTTRIVRHSFFALERVNDTVPLVYYEPYPDSMYPKMAIEIGTIVIQAQSADRVVEVLEKQARENGADWIVGFNEPRLHWTMIDGEPRQIYRSSALLLRVIDPELVPRDRLIAVDCGEEHTNECKSVLTWIDEEHKSK